MAANLRWGDSSSPSLSQCLWDLCSYPALVYIPIPCLRIPRKQGKARQKQGKNKPTTSSSQAKPTLDKTNHVTDDVFVVYRRATFHFM